MFGLVLLIVLLYNGEEKYFKIMFENKIWKCVLGFKWNFWDIFNCW